MWLVLKLQSHGAEIQSFSQMRPSLLGSTIKHHTRPRRSTVQQLTQRIFIASKLAYIGGISNRGLDTEYIVPGNSKGQL